MQDSQKFTLTENFSQTKKLNDFRNVSGEDSKIPTVSLKNLDLKSNVSVIYVYYCRLTTENDRRALA
jgi:hypothetical protein